MNGMKSLEIVNISETSEQGTVLYTFFVPFLFTRGASLFRDHRDEHAPPSSRVGRSSLVPLFIFFLPPPQIGLRVSLSLCIPKLLQLLLRIRSIESNVSCGVRDRPGCSPQMGGGDGRAVPCSAGSRQHSALSSRALRSYALRSRGNRHDVTTVPY